jgi:hypothetical protein
MIQRLAVLIVMLLTAVSNAQTGQKPSKSSPKKTADTESQQRRATMTSLLQSLAIEARSYRNESLRARIQARIADVIWDQDQDAARALFRRAWDVAETVETSNEAQASLPGRQPTQAPRLRATLRREVIQLAARRDVRLAEEFLAKLTPKQNTDSKVANAELSESEIAERLRLASILLESNDIDRALQLSAPAFIHINERSILFLIALRDKAADIADQQFARLLALTRADPSSDANTVSFLASYVLTPSIFLVVSPTGIPSGNNYPPRLPPDLAPGLRRSFFETAANILLRPFPQIDQSSAGRAGTYFIATRLLPRFQQFAPDLVPAITAQLAALGPEAARATANAGDIAINRGMSDDGQRVSFEEELKDRLDRAQDADARDRAYAHAAMSFAGEGDPRAQEFVNKIEDLETRKGVASFVDYTSIMNLLRRKQPDDALRLLRKADLPHTLRAHFLTQAAALTLKTDRVRATELFEEALSETRRIDAGTHERAYCLIALLQEISKLDKSRSWELLSETIKAANAVPDFTGETGNTSVTLEGKFGIRLSTELAEPTALSEIFVRLTAEDFYQALDVSKTFSGDAPRALAMIAVGKAVFSDADFRLKKI